MAGLRKALPPLITLAVVALALVLGFFAWTYYTRAPWTRDARVRADVVTVSADVTGRIVELRVKDNQHVSKGDLVHARGRLRQNSYERDGKRIYTVDLIALEFGRLAQAVERSAA